MLPVSQDLVLTVEWNDQENGADLERLLDGIDENRNGNIQDEQEWSRLYFVKCNWFVRSQDTKMLVMFQMYMNCGQ